MFTNEINTLAPLLTGNKFLPTDSRAAHKQAATVPYSIPKAVLQLSCTPHSRSQPPGSQALGSAQPTTLPRAPIWPT